MTIQHLLSRLCDGNRLTQPRKAALAGWGSRGNTGRDTSGDRLAEENTMVRLYSRSRPAGISPWRQHATKESNLRLGESFMRG